MANTTTGARALVDALLREGVDHVFGIPGTQNLAVIDALRETPQIRFILTRHEQGAAFMAYGFARAAGRPGVVTATEGPGVTNLATGIGAAYRGLVPVISVCGVQESSMRERDATQDMDQVTFMRPITKWAYSIPNVHKVQESVRRLRGTGNIKGEDLAEKQRALLGDHVNADARTLFFPGCEALSSGGEAVQDGIRVLEHLGFGPVAVLPDAPCSGSPYESAGAMEEFGRHAQRLAERLSHYTLIVSSCPSCVRTLTERYTAVGAPVRARVAHLVELAAERMPRGAATTFKAAYHDPCHLGRGLGHYEPPREALRRAGAEVVEWFDRRETSRCSGGGFGLTRTMPDAARAIAERRVSDVPESADVIATACPTCTAQLRAVSKKPVVEVATLLAKALGLRP